MNDKEAPLFALGPGAMCVDRGTVVTQEFMSIISSHQLACVVPKKGEA